jgi:F-type H+-transporting ATPase subunit b
MVFNEQFWLMVSFVIFVAIVYKSIKSFLLKFLDDRAAKIRSDLTECQKLEEDASAILQQYKDKLADLEKDIERIMTKAQEEIVYIKAKSKEDAESYLNKKTSQIMDKINSQEQLILNGMRNDILSIASEVVVHLIKEHLSEVVQKDMLNLSLDDLSKKLH